MMLRLFASLAFISLASSFPSEQSHASPRVTRCVTHQDCGNQYLECFKGYINGQPEQIGYCQNPWDFSRSCSTDYECLSGLSCQPLDPTKCFVEDPGITLYPRRIGFPNPLADVRTASCVKFCKVKRKELGKIPNCGLGIPPRPPWRCDRSMGQSIDGDQAMVAKPMADYIPNGFEGKQTGVGSGQFCLNELDCRNYPFMDCIKKPFEVSGTCQWKWGQPKTMRELEDI